MINKTKEIVIKITRKMIEMRDIFARCMPITASSVVAVCKINKKVADDLRGLK